MSLRHWFRKLEPRVLDMMKSAIFIRFKPWVDKHDVFSFEREPLARGLAFGLFCCLIPGPLQMLGALLACALWRGNAIAAFAATLVSNPLTIVPLYAIAFHLGTFVMSGHTESVSVSSITSLGFGSKDWFFALSTWIKSLGWPLVIGLPILGLIMAANAYALVQILWLWPVFQRLRRMQKKVQPF